MFNQPLIQAKTGFTIHAKREEGNLRIATATFPNMMVYKDSLQLLEIHHSPIFFIITHITNWYPVLKRHRDQLLATGPIRYMRTPCTCPHVSCTTPLRHIIAYTINWEIILRLSCGGLGQSVHSRSQPIHSRSQPMHSHKDVLYTCSLFTFQF